MTKSQHSSSYVSDYVYDYANDMLIAKLAFMHAVTPMAMLTTTPATMSMVTSSSYAHNYTQQLYLYPKATPTNSFYGGLYMPKSVTETQGTLMIHKR
jgi:hypothetical protein